MDLSKTAIIKQEELSSKKLLWYLLLMEADLKLKPSWHKQRLLIRTASSRCLRMLLSEVDRASMAALSSRGKTFMD